MSEASVPRITVVTPSLNQCTFIERTLRSVLDQAYPNLEYIVIDGGSSDGTVDVLRAYEPRLAAWVSEPDSGQADAINKGFRLSTGEILAFLNADDLYAPGALARVAADFAEGDGREWHAYPVQDFEGGSTLHRPPGLSRKLGDVPVEDRDRLANRLALWVMGRIGLHQPGVFWRRRHWLEAGGLDPRYHYAFDRHFFMKLVAAGYPLVSHPEPAVGLFRLHPGSKTVRNLRGVDNPFVRERLEIEDEFEALLPRAERRTVGRSRTDDAISSAWKMFREDAPRGDCLAWLARLAASRTSALGSRYFWGTALRFLTAGRPSRA
ncbi:MAG TPA: glycosyltransferase family 2 protein [Gemmatimonadota bacterium]|nr:glycosyltransferase family 2 protein [Gemmatimonadota bacterium]